MPSWSLGDAPPVPLDDCRQIATLNVRPNSLTRKQIGDVVERFLMSNWPWLLQSKQDLGGYINNLGLVIEAHSADALAHVTDAVTGPDWENDKPPTPQAFRRALAAYDDRTLQAVHAAERIVAEAARRAAEAEHDRQIEADRPKILQKLRGRSPLQAIIEEANK